jgi:4-aminobutyrate aminotransferase-like enzyme
MTPSASPTAKPTPPVPSPTHAGAAPASGIRPKTASGAPGTAAEHLFRNSTIDASIRAIVEQARTASSRLTGPRGPIADLKASYDDFQARAAEVRGRPLLYPFVGSGLGHGALVELADGSVKWDMICGIGVHFFGHSHPELIEASLRGSLDDTLKQGNLMSTFEPYQLAETILTEAKRKSKLRHAYIATGGAMANENALKVCFQKKYLDHLRSLAADANAKPEALLAKATPTMRAIAFKDCFMGRSMNMAQVGDAHAGREGLPNGIFVDYMPFWDAVAAERIGGKAKFIDMAVARLEEYIHRYPGGYACFIFELCQGEGGFNVGDRDYFKALMEVCKAHKVAVWDDEIQTFGRSPTSMFMYEHFDLGEYVDVFCVGKMTQACLTMWTEEFNPKTGILSGTFTGEGPSFRVGQRVVEMLRDGPPGVGKLYGQGGAIERHQTLFRQHAQALIAKHPDWFPAVSDLGGGGDKLIGGLGAMMRLTPFGGKKEPINKACKACFEEGVIIFYAGHDPFHLRMLPPLGVMKHEDWPRVFEALERGLARAAS